VGSFAYSLHAKCDDAARVAAAIERLLGQDDWRPTDQPPDEEASRFGAPSNRRAFQISRPVYGWVSVLDSDLAGAMTLAPQLAEQLDAFTLLCLVHDSDSWHYQLSRGDGVLDDFDSAGEEGMPSDLSEVELSQLTQGMHSLQAKIADGTFQEQMQRMNDEMIAHAPAGIQEKYRRIQAGQATPQDMAEYQAWAAAEAPKYTERIQQLVGELFNVPSLSKSMKGSSKSKKRKRKPTKAHREAVQQRTDNLRPLFVAGVTDEQFQEVLEAKAVFAEETLAKFLPLVGIPAFYAYLSYGYLAESSPQELAAQGIQFAQHLMFETSHPGLAAPDLADPDL
jgi:hypothetical protein